MEQYQFSPLLFAIIHSYHTVKDPTTIISGFYNFYFYSLQRTLLVTHSNQALNQLFEKIMALDIDERHLLRLGHGEEELQTEKDFSRSVNS